MLQADQSPFTTGASSVATSDVLTSSTSSSATTSTATESVAPRKSSSSKQATKNQWVRGLLEDSTAHKQTRIDLIVSAIKEGRNEIPGSSSSIMGYYGSKAVGMVGWGLGIRSIKNAAGTPLAEYVDSINPFDWNEPTRIDEKENVTAYSWIVSYAMSALQNINALETTTTEEIDDLKRSTSAKVIDLERARDEKVSQLQAEKERTVSELQRRLTADETAKKEAKKLALEKLEREKNEGERELQEQSGDLLKVHKKTLDDLKKSRVIAHIKTVEAIAANDAAIEILKKEKEDQKSGVKDKFKAEFAALQNKGGEDIEAAQVKADQAIEETKAIAKAEIAAARLREKTTIESKTLKQTNEVQAGFTAINSCMGYLDTIMKNMRKEDIVPDDVVTNDLFRWIVEATRVRKDSYAEQLKTRAVVLQKTMIECGVEQDETAARSLTRLVGKSKLNERKRGSFSSTSPKAAPTSATTTTTTTSTTRSDPEPIELSSNADKPGTTPPNTIVTSVTSSDSIVPPLSTTAIDSLAPYSDTVLSPASRLPRQSDEATREGGATITVEVPLSAAQNSVLAFGGADVDEASVTKADSSTRANDATLTVVTSSNEAGSLDSPQPSPVLPRSNSNHALDEQREVATKANEAMQSPRVNKAVVLVGPAGAAEVRAAETDLSSQNQAFVPSSPSDDEPAGLGASMIMSLESSPSQPSDEPTIPEPNRSREASPSREAGADSLVAANDDNKPRIVLAPQRRAAVIPTPQDVTVHVVPGETKQEGKVSADQAKLARVQTELPFKYAFDSKSHSSMGILITQSYDPCVLRDGQYAIEVALRHLKTKTSLSNSALYDYMMHSIEAIDSREDCGRKINVESLNAIVAGTKGYDATIKQNWVKYVENKGKLSEVGLAA